MAKPTRPVTVWLLLVAILAFPTLRRLHAAQFTFTTGLLLLGLVSALLFHLVEAFGRSGRLSAASRVNARVLVATLALLLCGVEALSRFALRSHLTYSELNGRTQYISPYPRAQPSWFFVYPPDTVFESPKSEFVHVRTTNSLGLVDREMPLEPPPGECRIIALGDSFTEGVGAPPDSTWVKAMERSVQRQTPGVTVTTLNGGRSGSDVWFAYILLKEQLVRYRPSLVIVAINNTDVHDVMMRGGHERFKADGTMAPRMKAPWWEGLYGLSFTFRHVVHDLLGYDRWLMKPGAAAAEEPRAVASVLAAVDSIGKVSRRHGFDVLFVVHPDQGEIGQQQYEEDFAQVVRRLQSDRSVTLIDLLHYYLAHGIMTPNNADDLFWSLDSHHNPRGYQAMGDAIAAVVLRLHPCGRAMPVSTQRVGL